MRTTPSSKASTVERLRICVTAVAVTELNASLDGAVERDVPDLARLVVPSWRKCSSEVFFLGFSYAGVGKSLSASLLRREETRRDGLARNRSKNTALSK